jgi:hypothetical protein
LSKIGTGTIINSYGSATVTVALKKKPSAVDGKYKRFAIFSVSRIKLWNLP